MMVYVKENRLFIIFCVYLKIRKKPSPPAVKGHFFSA
jgi:hypothetical protein